jgi:hypothetical protein
MKRHLRQSAFERIVKRWQTEPGLLKTDCWVWPLSACNKGYGFIAVGRTSRRVHIVAWECANGRRVKKGYTLDHLCRNKKCWRPTHQEEVTRAINTARGNRANPRSTVKAREAKAMKLLRRLGDPPVGMKEQ